MTASVNLIWGCKFMSPSTGIIMNNQMDDFAIPGVIRYIMNNQMDDFAIPGDIRSGTS